MSGDVSGCFDAVHAGHAHVHEDHVGQRPVIGVQLVECVDGGLPVLRRGDDGDVGHVVEHELEAESCQSLVVHEHHTDHGRTFLSVGCFPVGGMTALTCHSVPLTGP